MGLFHRRAKKNREKAVAEPLKEGTTTPLEEETTTAKAHTEAAPREAVSEARPDPDQPGWGETIGQQIGKTREARASQE
jgi:hypothetical protein